ncbi:zinc finger protein 236-like [Uranotaenia lowii]|uniref:zinc finger protein 236-like n=1 Tax=Uranotaenia lowii TaxID=190385 RepID=UPI0024785CAD|nr:zinc finger protein 236-like [Uranotaenia lowii]
MEVDHGGVKVDPTRSRRSGVVTVAAGQLHSRRRAPGGNTANGSRSATVAAAAVSPAMAPVPVPGPTVTVKVGLNMNMCRLCLAEGTPSSRLLPVYYAKDTPDEPLVQKILELTTIQVQYATDFPSSICNGCRGKLEEYHIFRRQCIENDEILRIKYYEIKAAEQQQAQQLQQQHQQQQQQQQHHHQPAQQQAQIIAEEKMTEEYIDDGDDITLAIDESAAEVEEYQEEETTEEVVQQPDQVVEQQTIQYVAADGTMTEYIEAGDVRTVSSANQQQQIHISGYGEAEGVPSGEGHEIYYTDGTDTYAIHTTTEGYVNAANYVPQGYENQTEIECTTIDEEMPEEEMYVDESGTPVGTVITPRGVHDRPYVCKHCKTSFKYEYNYERHMKNHAKVLYRCGKCSKTFTKQRKCQQHFLKAHSSQRYECDICFRTYSLPTRLENHVIEMHSENGVYKCDRCVETFTSYLDFKSHRNSQHNINGSSNATSVVTTVSAAAPATTVIAQAVEQRNLPLHQQQQHVNKSPSIHQPVAPASVSTRSSVSDTCDFEVMIDETKIQKPSVTDSPAAKRATVLSAEQEMMVVEEEVAPIANNTNNNKAHAIIATTSGGGKLVVSSNSLVPSAITTTATVITTTATATAAAASVPNVSTITTTASAPQQPVTNGGIDRLAMHRQLLQQIEESEANSSGPKIYKCDNCPKTFVHLNNLKAHIYAEHDNDKPFKCKLCPISFKTKEILVMHMVLHAQHNTTT